MHGGLALRFVKRNQAGKGSLPGHERVYRILRDGRFVGRLFLWPAGSAVVFDARGHITRERTHQCDSSHVVDALSVIAPQPKLQGVLF